MPAPVEHVSVCAMRRLPDNLLVEHASVKLAAACCAALALLTALHLTAGSKQSGQDAIAQCSAI